MSREVIIVGGGLAGLTLSLQLKRVRPETSVLVLERRAHDAREAAFKVGESTVEVGAHYYAEVVGLRDHLERDQLPKYGLRFFMPAGGRSRLAGGNPVYPATRSTAGGSRTTSSSAPATPAWTCCSERESTTSR